MVQSLLYSGVVVNYTKGMSLWRAFQENMKILLSIVGFWWAVLFINMWLFHGNLNHFGIRPHDVSGLQGILFSPFLHGNIQHAAANTIPFIILGALILIDGVSFFVAVSFGVMILSGLGTWFIGSPDQVHIGMSSIVFGYFGYLLSAGWYSQNPMRFMLGLGVALWYGLSFMYALVPQIGISWQGHLCGLLAGFFMGRVLWMGRSRTLPPEAF